MRRFHRYTRRCLDYDSFKTMVGISLSLRLGEGFQVRSIVDQGTDFLLILSENLHPVSTPMESLYEGYRSCRDLEQVVEAVRTSYLVSARPVDRSFEGGSAWAYPSGEDESLIGQKVMESLERMRTTIEDREFAMSHVVCSVINQDRNAGELSLMPHIPFLDLAVTFSILMNPGSGFSERGFETTVLAPVVFDIYDLWDVAPDEFIEAARENTIRLMPCRILPAGASSEVPASYVMTNDRQLNGAYWMTDQDALTEVSRRMGGKGFYILPSSLNECMIVGRGKMTISAMREYLEKSNAKHREDELFLSDNIYYYSAVKKKVRIV